MFIAQLRRDLGQAYHFSIYDVLSLLVYLNGPNVFRIYLLRIDDHSSRQLEIDPLLQQGRRDDENDEQDKRQIQQRSDIDIAQRDQRIPLRKSTHFKFCYSRASYLLP